MGIRSSGRKYVSPQTRHEPYEDKRCHYTQIVTKCTHFEPVRSKWRRAKCPGLKQVELHDTRRFPPLGRTMSV